MSHGTSLSHKSPPGNPDVQVPIAVWGLNIRLVEVELLSARFRLHMASYLVNCEVVVGVLD